MKRIQPVTAGNLTKPTQQTIETTQTTQGTVTPTQPTQLKAEELKSQPVASATQSHTSKVDQLHNGIVSAVNGKVISMSGEAAQTIINAPSKYIAGLTDALNDAVGADSEELDNFLSQFTEYI